MDSAPSSPISNEERLKRARSEAYTADRSRNRLTIRDFIVLPILNLVPLPPELENEPYAFIDTGLRPDVIGPTGFAFAVGSDAHLVRAGSIFKRTKHEVDDDDLPEKGVTHLSISGVYDLYGLDITYSYLKFLYERRYNRVHPEWLALYLLGSLAVMQPDVLTEHVAHEDRDILLLCMRLLILLLDKDSKQPRLLGELVPLSEGESLPTEIIARITNSRRLSTSITTSVLARQHTLIPTRDELQITTMYNDRPYTTSEYDGETLDDTSRLIITYIEDETDEVRHWLLYPGEKGITLETGPGNAPMSEPYLHRERVQFSLDSYAWVFEQRGCDSKRAMTDMLRGLMTTFSIVGRHNIEEACAWLIQLSFETAEGQPRVFNKFIQIRDELQRLLLVAIDDLNL